MGVSVVSIPIILLRKTQMRLSQKVSLGGFLCLSLVMVCIAFVRAAGFRIGKAEDITWDLYWIYMEACIACIMASVTAMRTVFSEGGSKRSKPRYDPSNTIKERMMRKIRAKTPWVEVEGQELPNIPSATLTGMRTYIGGNDGKSMTETSHSVPDTETIV